MRLRSLNVVMLACVVSAIGGLHDRSATAQLVQVGPGYVRAPFVRVYSYPDGSSYVRAPFVSIYSPPRFYVLPGDVYAAPATPGPRIVSRSLGSLEDVSQPLERQRRQLAAASRQLQRDLSRINAPASWFDFLGLPPEVTEPDSSSSQPEMSPSGIESLQRVLANFEQTRQEAKYRVIAELPGFQTTHAHLSQYIGLATGSAQEAAEELPPPVPEKRGESQFDPQP